LIGNLLQVERVVFCLTPKMNFDPKPHGNDGRSKNAREYFLPRFVFGKYQEKHNVQGKSYNDKFSEPVG
jgi:hypothetical protein